MRLESFEPFKHLILLCQFVNAIILSYCRKTHGMGAGRKLKSHRRTQRWADKSYKKSHLGNEWKKPFAGSSHAKGIVLEKMLGSPHTLSSFSTSNWFAIDLWFNQYRGIEAKQPNSAIRKCARVQLIKNGKKIAAFVPNDGCLNYIEENVGSLHCCELSLQSLYVELTSQPYCYIVGRSVDCWIWA